MTNIPFQFSRPELSSENTWDRLISEGICKMTRSEICHVDLIVPQANGGYTLRGAHSNGGYQERASNYQVFGLRIRVWVPCTENQEAIIYAQSQAMIGTPYDTRAIEGIAFGNAAIHTEGLLICSSADAILVDDKAHAVRIAKDHWQVSPEELRIALMAGGDKDHTGHTVAITPTEFVRLKP